MEQTANLRSLRARLLAAAGVLAAATLHGAARAQDPEPAEEACIPPEKGTCPADAEAMTRISEENPDRCYPIVAEPDAAKLVNGQCCYMVYFDCSSQIVGCTYSGRPLIIEGRPLAAGTRAADGFLLTDFPLPETAGLLGAEREALALGWARVAAAELASIAGFQRFSLDLMANGAPPHLLLAAQRGAIDELSHARLAFTLASAFAGAPVGPAPLGLPSAIGIHRTRRELARATVEEGCTVETLSARLLAEAEAQATDAAVRRALRRMRRDEERHAALAWETLAWALSEDPSIAAEVDATFEQALSSLAAEGLSPVRGLERFGLLDPQAARACHEVAVRTLITPCREGLLGRARWRG